MQVCQRKKVKKDQVHIYNMKSDIIIINVNYQNLLYTMQTNKTLYTTIGFLMFVVGFLAIFLSLVGLNLSYLSWINKAIGDGGAFLVNVCLIVGGSILVYMTKANRD